MGKALELIAARALNPGAGGIAATPGSGDQFAVRSGGPTGRTYLENLWRNGVSAGFVRVRSPRMHDNLQGIRFTPAAGNNRALLPDELRQILYSQDVLTVELAGGAAETDTAALLLHYDDVPGLDARLATLDQLTPRIANVLTVEVATAAGATAGDWNAGTAINATFDLLKANTDYAILGYVTSAPVTGVAVRGPDTGNVRTGGPGTTEQVETRDWFVSLSRAISGPAIPVINSANKGATAVFAFDVAAGTAVTVDLIAAELTPGNL